MRDFLWRGITLDFFQDSGNTEFVRIELNMKVTTGNMIGSSILMNEIGTLSKPSEFEVTLWMAVKDSRLVALRNEKLLAGIWDKRGRCDKFKFNG